MKGHQFIYIISCIVLLLSGCCKETDYNISHVCPVTVSLGKVTADNHTLRAYGLPVRCQKE